MKSIKKLGLLLVALIIVGSVATAVVRADNTQASSMAAQQQMMMKMMMQNRPKAMKEADAAIQKVKAEAMKKGMYNCCLKHSCDSCALTMGACPCGKHAAMDMPVCNECKGGWAAGDGAIPGKTNADIKTFPRGNMPMGGKMMGMASPATSKVIDVAKCPITGEKVVGAGTGMERVANYEVHFCCAGCQPMFDKLSTAEKIRKIHAVLKSS